MLPIYWGNTHMTLLDKAWGVSIYAASVDVYSCLRIMLSDYACHYTSSGRGYLTLDIDGFSRLFQKKI